MDALQLKVDTYELNGHQVHELVFTVNGRDLIEILRDIETPYVVASRVAALPGVNLNDPALLVRYRKWAAIYMGINLEEFQEIRDDFLGKTEFNVRPAYSTILKCGGCGEIGCSSFTVGVQRSGNRITWSHYSSGHRDWTYDTLPAFTFDATQYEAEVAKIAAV